MKVMSCSACKQGFPITLRTPHRPPKRGTIQGVNLAGWELVGLPPWFPESIAEKLPTPMKWSGNQATDGLSEIGNLLKTNGYKISGEELESMRAWANQQWCERDPDRCQVTQSLSKQASSLLAAAAGEVKAIAQRKKRISRTDQKYRVDVCKECEFYLKNLRRCSVCSCFVNAKAAMRSEDCPKGKWPKL